MLDGLTFGWRTAILLVAVGQLLLIAAALSRTLHNRSANRTLALLLVVLSGILTPWMIGFAGFYDRWRWLTFAPFAITLAVAPLLYLYVEALVAGRWPVRAWRHLVAPSVQLAFLTTGFLLPWPLKDAWADASYREYEGLTGALCIAGLASYGIVGLRRLAAYRALLAAQRSDDHRFAARWLSRAITAAPALCAVWGTYLLWDAVAPLGYVGLMGLYIAIAAFGLYLGIEGWRHAERPFPPMATLAIAPEPATRDWRRIGEGWAVRVRSEGWSAEPELSLPVVARRLGTNTAHLSRALNEGLGVNFSTFVNGLRCDTVAAALDAGSDANLLTLALDAGFGSKASFNRAFQAAYGVAPSDYRRRVLKSK